MKWGYEVRITKQALKDIQALSLKLKKKLKSILLEVLSKSPHEGKKLIGELAGNYSLRLTLHDRIAYSVDEENKTVYIKRARTHHVK